MSNLSLVIPAFNEEHRLAPSLRRILSFFEERRDLLEIVVVDDGSEDRTWEVVESFPAPVRGIRLDRNRGKGAALRSGVAATTGARLLLTDADLSAPIEDLVKLEGHLAEVPFVIGSRSVEGADVTRRQPLYRESMGRIFNVLIRSIGLGFGFRDTQCGFKLLDGAVGRALMAASVVDGFAYDVELIWLARRAGLEVREVGVTWRHVEESRVRLVRHSLAMLWDVARFRFEHRATRLDLSGVWPCPAAAKHGRSA
ncbi:MAG TPA: dolichyl-phosphate beta-glucosyltransferase [Thermoanaerobaculia bacterium]|nr:dolichyl-phosphate beta-glucosyltransferase [Thermoanaerobaculia bacterium]